VIRFNPPSAERQAKTQPCAIGAALLERAEQVVGIPARETAALILDFDEHPLLAAADS
jgi:hypothetical protein